MNLESLTDPLLPKWIAPPFSVALLFSKTESETNPSPSHFIAPPFTAELSVKRQLSLIVIVELSIPIAPPFSSAELLKKIQLLLK